MLSPKPSVIAAEARLLFELSDLCKAARKYLGRDAAREIRRAYHYGAKAHAGQYRVSGAPYISHPLAVARILVEMRLDLESIEAALLHDVLEDTAVDKEELAAEFGEEVTELVDGVSKLAHIRFDSRAEAQAESIRKMFLAMARDIRVILVKLADRTHNMRTLGALRPDKRRKIAHETLEIYAPIANRLGLNGTRQELEDLGFSTLYPQRARALSAALKKGRGHRKQVVKKIETSLKRRLRQEELVAETTGREKHLFSLYRKMRDKRLPFAEVMDVHAFRIIVETPDECYRVLGVVHNLYKPIPGKFKDYIANPKANGYQSLHTALFGPYGGPLEVQIRTRDMHDVAEAGIAAHWLYKDEHTASSAAQKRARDWLRELLEMQKGAGNSIEFIENVKVDLFPDEVYVFTPAGKIMELPRGATVVDFAYAVHSDIGNTCVAAKVDRRYAPLRAVLETGQAVEIVTAAWGVPHPNWLNYVVTAKARTHIRAALKKLQAGEAGGLGKRLLDQALATHSRALDEVPQAHLEQLLKETGSSSLEALFEDIGMGERMAPLVARRLTDLSGYAPVDTDADDERPLVIKGTEGMVVSFAKCCRPIPGDDILGFASAGRGIVIHRQGCNNLGELMSRRERWIEVEWASDVDSVFRVDVRVDVENRRGVLASVASAISGTDANIDNVDIREREGQHSSLLFSIEVRDRVHLASTMRAVHRMPRVMRISRVDA